MKLASKKIIKKTIESFVLLTILLSVMFGLIIEPDFKIKGFESLDENKLKKSHMLTILDDEYNPVSENIQSEQIYIALKEVPLHVQDAFISVEDRRYFMHNGIDYIRIASAIKNNLIARSYAEGASTISQQLIKNTHLSNEKTMSRKLQEMRIAIDLERNFSKNDILETYLNVLYFGNNIYGIANAAKTMFGKETIQLTIAEGALLAGIINNPALFNPYTNHEKSKNRRNIVLSRMKKENKISDEEFNFAINEEIVLEKLDKSHSEYYKSIIKEAAEHLHCSTSDIYSRKLTIKTNLDSNIYLKVESIVKNMSNQNENCLAKAIVLNNLSGSITALSTISPYDISNSHRQPGSVIKPFLSFVPILESGLAVPTTPILDEKVDFNGFSPSNYKNRYEGWTTLKTALAKSSNVCAVKLMEMNGIENSIACAERFGLNFEKKDKSLALSLGSMQNGLTLTQLANAYQAFANNGYLIKPSFIDLIKDENDQIIYKRKITEVKACSSETAFFMNEMLKECAKSGTAKKLNRHKNICAKTGTVGDENGNTDAYCIAYSPEYTVAIWMGSNDYSTRIKPTGGGVPTDIAAKIFDILPKTSQDFSIPDSIIEAEIDTNILKSKHKIVAATNSTLPKYKQKEYFTKTTLPKQG